MFSSIFWYIFPPLSRSLSFPCLKSISVLFAVFLTSFLYPCELYKFIVPFYCYRLGVMFLKHHRNYYYYQLYHKHFQFVVCHWWWYIRCVIFRSLRYGSLLSRRHQHVKINMQMFSPQWASILPDALTLQYDNEHFQMDPKPLDISYGLDSHELSAKNSYENRVVKTK